ncbi:MAG: HEAT repeat domain-containing protein [Gammaproteobacteria bacterium]
MKRLFWSMFILIAVSQGALLSRTACALTPAKPLSLTERTGGPLPTPLIEHRDGVIVANVSGVPLGKMLEELEHKAGLQAKISESLVNLPVFAILRRASLKETLTTILDGLSYVIYPAKSGLVVVVLSTPPKEERRHGRSRSRPIVTQLPGNGGITQKANALETVTDRENGAKPQTLDEFRPISMEMLTATSGIESGNDTDASGQLLMQQRYQEARLDRALDALGSEHKPLYKEALNDLIGIDDPRATKAIVDAALTPTEWISRISAVETLSQHALNLQFSDRASVNALRQLVEDGDVEVRQVVRNVLTDMQAIEEMR